MRSRENLLLSQSPRSVSERLVLGVEMGWEDRAFHMWEQALTQHWVREHLRIGVARHALSKGSEYNEGNRGVEV